MTSKKKTFGQRLKNKIFFFLSGLDADKLKPIQNEISFYAGDEDLNQPYLFDFKNYSAGGTGIVSGGNITWGDSSSFSKPATPQKIKVKPIDVLNELEEVPNIIKLSHLDEKLSVLKDKEKLISQKYAKREIKGLIQRLENRKKYNDFKSFFEQFPNTTDEKIDVLTSKYDLVMKTSDIFIPEFPNEAIQIMKDYTAKMQEVCGKDPVFYVIATEESFKKSYEKRDPILLVQSPFGFYWQILGAWDKEMILLSEL